MYFKSNLKTEFVVKFFTLIKIQDLPFKTKQLNYFPKKKNKEDHIEYVHHYITLLPGFTNFAYVLVIKMPFCNKLR